MPHIRIEQAVEKDIPLILEFIRALGDYERLAHEVVATEELLRASLFGPRPAAETLIAYLNGEPMGFALFFPNYSTFLGRAGIHLEDLYVHPHGRGRGVGKALLLHLARLAHQRGRGRLEWSVLDWNEPSIGFYKSLGAVPMDEWTTFRVEGKALERLAQQAEQSRK